MQKIPQTHGAIGSDGNSAGVCRVKVKKVIIVAGINPGKIEPHPQCRVLGADIHAENIMGSLGNMILKLWIRQAQ